MKVRLFIDNWNCGIITVSLKQAKKLAELNRQRDKDINLCIRREKLRKEYQAKVERGELRPPTRTEKLIEIARGHIDNESVKAARRLLIKRGVTY